jgi:hypothetical protein
MPSLGPDLVNKLIPISISVVVISLSLEIFAQDVETERKFLWNLNLKEIKVLEKECIEMRTYTDSKIIKRKQIS